MTSKRFDIAVIEGDGIGPEITSCAKKVLDKTGDLFSYSLNYIPVCMGGKAIDDHGEPFPAEEREKCLKADSVLLSAVGGPKWDNCPERPEKGLLTLRKIMECFANLRLIRLFPELSDASPLKRSILDKGIDIMVVRELTGGIYFGEHSISERSAYDIELYNDYEIERVVRRACEIAMKRKKKLCLADKANVLSSSKLWRRIFTETVNDYPQIECTYMYIDNLSMQLIRDPSQFDVIVTSNMFGDIITDEASMLTGSLGMIPSASLGNSSKGIYEPIHGSAPDIAGRGIANPCAMILSGAMMLRYSFDLPKAADMIEKAVENVLKKGYRTRDIATEGCILTGSEEFTDIIIKEIEDISKCNE